MDTPPPTIAMEHIFLKGNKVNYDLIRELDSSAPTTIQLYQEPLTARLIKAYNEGDIELHNTTVKQLFQLVVFSHSKSAYKTFKQIVKENYIQLQGSPKRVSANAIPYSRSPKSLPRNELKAYLSKLLEHLDKQPLYEEMNVQENIVVMYKHDKGTTQYIRLDREIVTMLLTLGKMFKNKFKPANLYDPNQTQPRTRIFLWSKLKCFINEYELESTCLLGLQGFVKTLLFRLVEPTNSTSHSVVNKLCQLYNIDRRIESDDSLYIWIKDDYHWKFIQHLRENKKSVYDTIIYNTLIEYIVAFNQSTIRGYPSKLYRGVDNMDYLNGNLDNYMEMSFTSFTKNKEYALKIAKQTTSTLIPTLYTLRRENMTGMLAAPILYSSHALKQESHEEEYLFAPRMVMTVNEAIQIDSSAYVFDISTYSPETKLTSGGGTSSPPFKVKTMDELMEDAFHRIRASHPNTFRTNKYQELLNLDIKGLVAVVWEHPPKGGEPNILKTETLSMLLWKAKGELASLVRTLNRHRFLALFKNARMLCADYIHPFSEHNTDNASLKTFFLDYLSKEGRMIRRPQTAGASIRNA